MLDCKHINQDKCCKIEPNIERIVMEVGPLHYPDPTPVCSDYDSQF